jgi:predicted MFS family arabinose efflux permease
MSLLAEHIPVAEALTSGYRLAFVVAVGCATASLVAACVLLPSRPRRGAGSAVEGAVHRR